MPYKIGQHGSGVKIEDLLDSQEFQHRAEGEDPDRVRRAVEHLRETLHKSPDTVFQELVQLAVDVCHADSSGISLEEENEKGELQFRWIAVAGSFAQYLNGTTPRFYSPCGTCLDRGVPQLYQVFDPYYNFLGVTADPILDGMLIPWRSERVQGTIWLVSHRSRDAFTRGDYELMRTLADIVSEGMRSSAFEERAHRPA